MFQFARRSSVAGVFAAALLAANVASAALITFSTSGAEDTITMSNALDATVTLEPRTGATVDLTPGIPQIVLLNDAVLDTFLLSTAEGTGTLAQELTITAPAATPTSNSLSQDVSVTTTSTIFGTTGSAIVGPASAIVFDLGPVGMLTVTPQGGSIIGTTQQVSNFENNAEFLLTAVPEPAAASMLLAGANLLLSRRSRRV